ncbi:regulatory GntR family protein [Micromonospora sp. M71_S20]|uniref:GntR family transcriptional regulator n=1 Tax=Micromonospora sp. M71_S20 TaxID=592872 RepID=UPI000F2D7D3A|nr:winged helix-turn-helix domain-containing protein [Micromonospora sp. M71_S20]RLK22684.1 regulatory GntR family protein [Micromonospora sp. M71_S20]
MPVTPPKYQRIYAAIRAAIESGEYAPGARLPSEAAFAREFGVTHVTVRQALAELRRDGLVEPRQGVGTFVRECPS